MELSEAGYFSKTHGVKGGLILKTGVNLNVEDLKVLFIETNGGKAPYFISEVKETAAGVFTQLETVDAIEKAKLLLNKKVFVGSEFIVEEEESDSDWIGFELIDQQHGTLGQIEDVWDNGVQLLFTLRYKGAEIILPVVEEFIEKTDAEAKKIWYRAPEGLIDLYLEPKQ